LGTIRHIENRVTFCRKMLRLANNIPLIRDSDEHASSLVTITDEFGIDVIEDASEE
jgi:hypothetical protein